MKGVRGFQKGNKLGGRPPGALNKTTLLREERRAIFEQEVSDMFIDTIRAARPEYLLDQFLGKAPDTVNVNAKVDTSNEIAELAAKAAELLKEKKL